MSHSNTSLQGLFGSAERVSFVSISRLLGTYSSRAAQRIYRWHQLARQRRQLAAMSDRMLEDIGLSRAQVEEEARRPFWDDPRGQ